MPVRPHVRARNSGIEKSTNRVVELWRLKFILLRGDAAARDMSSAIVSAVTIFKGSAGDEAVASFIRNLAILD
jgi:hypothetical protein